MLDSAGFVLVYTPWWLSDLLYTVGAQLQCFGAVGWAAGRASGL